MTTATRTPAQERALALSRAEDARVKALHDALTIVQREARFAAWASDWQAMAADGRGCE